MSSFMWPQFVFSKFVLRLLCQLVLKTAGRSHQLGGNWHTGISCVSWDTVLAISALEMGKQRSLIGE